MYLISVIIPLRQNAFTTAQFTPYSSIDGIAQRKWSAYVLLVF